MTTDDVKDLAGLVTTAATNLPDSVHEASALERVHEAASGIGVRHFGFSTYVIKV